VVAAYESPSQRARVLTETWTGENLYCPACPSDSLESVPTGKRVVDFVCVRCDERYQLKSQNHPFGVRVLDSAYEPKVQALRRGTIPNFLFLHYDPARFVVLNLFVVPKYFMSESVIEQRRPLSERARRRGWIGSTILLGNLPPDARIPIIEDGQEVQKSVVRNLWSQFLFLQGQTVHSRGWLADVLACVRQLDKGIFTLADVYAFENQLAKLHPRNKHIKPKIRQQLQILRDHGVVGFLGKGTYQIRKP